MTFFPEIDEKATIKNAKRKLREYPRWREIAWDNAEQQITPLLTFMPRGGGNSPSRPVERLAICKVDAELELEAIELAVNKVFAVEARKILIDKYLLTHTKQDVEIYMAMGYERSQYFELAERALLSFANLYRDGALVVYSKSDFFPTFSGQSSD